MKKIPYAVGSFEEIQEQGYYYVDKTRHIAALENWKAPVFCVPGVSAKAFGVPHLNVITISTARINFHRFLETPGSGKTRPRLKTAL